MVILVCLASWALSHVYWGLFHDAGLYTLQALAHLRPGSLPQDVFLRYGSQDRFTLFSPLYASVIRGLGVEPGAAALTFLFQVGFLAGSWALARAVMPKSFALLGVAVLVAVPGYYGSDRIFSCIEPFLTPRMAAEALTLAGLAAAMRGRRTVCAVFVAVASILHPIMAAAGIAALLCMFVAVPRPRLAMMLTAAGLSLIVIEACVMPSGEWGRFDDAWLGFVHARSPYLFLLHWGLDDWCRVAVLLATLIAGERALAMHQARMLCRITLLTVLAGLALTLVSCDWLHLVLFTQLQPWRWQWLGIVVTALLLPQILAVLWNRGVDAEGRTTALLLIAAWIFASNEYALAAAGAGVASLACARRLKPGEARLVCWGAGGLLAIAVVWRVATNLEFTDAHYLDPQMPLWLRRAMSFTHDGTMPFAVIALSSWLGRCSQRRLATTLLTAIAGFAIAACISLVPNTLHSWTSREYPNEQVARYTAFRKHIPSGSDVFWPEAPVGVWLLLDSPSYISVIQTSGMVFSRQSALELNRRAHALSASVSPAAFMGGDSSGTGMTLSKMQLEQACATDEFAFLVTSVDLDRQPVEVIPTPGSSSRRMRLYRCRG